MSAGLNNIFTENTQDLCAEKKREQKWADENMPVQILCPEYAKENGLLLFNTVEQRTVHYLNFGLRIACLRK